MAYPPPPPPPPGPQMKRPYPSDWEAPPRPPKAPSSNMHEPAFCTAGGHNWGESLGQFGSRGYSEYQSRYDPPPRRIQGPPSRRFEPQQSSSYDSPAPGRFKPPPTGAYSDSNANVDFTDDYSAFYGKAERGGTARGGANFRRGGANTSTVRGRGGNFNSQNSTHQTTQPNRGGGQQLGRGGNPNTYRGGNTNNSRGQYRGRGRGQRGMPPNAFNAPSGRGKGRNKNSNSTVVPPVHSLAKAKPSFLDIESMSVAEKLHRFCLYLRNQNAIKVNAIQTIMNAISSSRLKLVPFYEAEELVRIEGKVVYTGILRLDDVFVARTIHSNKKELKQEVFQKALNAMLTKTVAEIFNLVDPGPDALKDELLSHRHAASAAKREPVDASQAEARSLVQSDQATVLKQLLNALVNMKESTLGPVSIIDQAATQARCLLKPEYSFEAVKLVKNRAYCVGKLTVGSLVIGRGGGSTKKLCKFDTYRNALERFKEKTLSELLESVPEDVLPMIPEEDEKTSVGPKRSELSLERRFADLIQKLGSSKGFTGTANQVDSAAMMNGITPMILLRNDPSPLSSSNKIYCDLFLEDVFIASAEGVNKRNCLTKLYLEAMEVLKSTDAKTLVTEHRHITEEEKNAPNTDIIIKGYGQTIESNRACLKKIGHDINELDKNSIDDLIVIEHSDWSVDRARNSFSILQSTCRHCGLLLQWELDFVNSKFRCRISIQNQEMGMSYGHNKAHARSLAASDALFKLYEKYDVITLIPRAVSEDKWIRWEKIKEAADKLREENISDEPVLKNDEQGNPLPDTFIMKVLREELNQFLNKSGNEELVFGPGIGPLEARELRNLVRDNGLRCDTLLHQGLPYLLVYNKLDWKTLVKVLKESGKPYGKYVFVNPEELPKHADIEKNLIQHVEEEAEPTETD